MRRLQFTVLLAAMALAAPAAMAADLVRPLPVAPVPLPAGGWYLRADLGYKWYADPTAIFDAPSFGPGYVVPGNGELQNESLKNAWAFGGGIGYDPVGPFRTDFTVDYETPANFHGNLACLLCGVGPGPGFSNETADISAWTGLANFYVDLGSHPNFTPYVGAGAGFDELITTNVASDNPPGSSYPGAHHATFAWARMAGVTTNLTPGLKLDINYRYLNLGEARSGVIDDGTGNTGFFQYQNIHASEIRIGIRHQL